MKKLITIIVTMLISSFTWAQQEISLDLADAIGMKTMEVSYEYYLSDKSSVGISALFNFNGKTSDFRYNEESMITPFFRHYFTHNNKWNYFGEIFFGLNSGEEEIKVSNIKQIENYTDGALGISIGSKYVSNGGLIISTLAGIGRNMFTDIAPALVPRVSLNIGYRF